MPSSRQPETSSRSTARTATQSSLALQLYCAIAQDWAENVIEGRDLSDSYPIEVAPTKEHAEMLLGRVDFIRRALIPLAEPSLDGQPGA